MADLYKMKAKAGFTNSRIRGPRTSGAVLPDETFETDFLHARELHASGMAEPADGVDLDTEPTAEVAPHHGLSVAEHKTINDRRAKAAKGIGGTGDDTDRTKAAAAALERVQTARTALDEADRAAKDKPSAAARAKLAEAQDDYDAAEAKAKAFTGA